MERPALARYDEARNRNFRGNAIRQHYLDWGGGNASPTVVLIHGGRDHARTWDDVVASLPPAWRIVAPNLRGHGDSARATGSHYSLWDYVGDLDAFTRMLKRDSSPLVLVGHSLGGAISLQLAGARPAMIDAIIAIEPFGLGRGMGANSLVAGGSYEASKVTPTEEHLPSIDRLRSHLDSIRSLENRSQVSYATIDDALERFRRGNPRLSETVARRMVEFGTNRGRDRRYSWKFDNRARTQSPHSFDMREAEVIWGNIRAPLLFVDGAESRSSRPLSAGFSEFFPGAEFAVIDGSAHMVQLEQPGALASLVCEFVTRNIRGS